MCIRDRFEELETFSRFGARLDEDTRKTIEHGRRIRACLKQPELAPVPVPEQIAMLLALTAELFDRVPLEQMTDAEHALRKAAADIPAEVRKRLDTADKLSDEDRKTIIQIARKSLVPFQPKPEPEAKPEVKTEVKSKPESEPKPDAKAEVKPKAESETRPEVKAEVKSKPESEPKPEAKAEVKPKAEPAAKPEVKAEVKPVPKPEEKS